MIPLFKQKKEKEKEIEPILELNLSPRVKIVLESDLSLEPTKQIPSWSQIWNQNHHHVEMVSIPGQIWFRIEWPTYIHA